MSALHHNSITNSNPLTKLVDVENHVGFMLSINFEEAVFLSNDFWKESVAGIPMNSFLVASAFYAGNYAETPKIDREVILLRVMGPSEMSIDRAKLDAMIDSYTKRTQVERAKRKGSDSFDFDEYDGFDHFTHTELQFGALKCRVIGSFYLKNGVLNLGADIENFASASHLRVYKPTSEALETIVNFVDPIRKTQALKKAEQLGFQSDTPPLPFALGTVRYTSTDRLHRENHNALVKVGVNPIDFLSRRTGVFGMTRTGKSNMVKTLSSSVALTGVKNKVRIGQCIFDINGEYANANSQDDGSSIADIFQDNVVCYRATKPPKESFKDLRNNFFEHPQIGLNIIQEELKQYSNLAADISTLSGMSLESSELEDPSEKSRRERRIEAFKVLMASTGFQTPSDLKISIKPASSIMRQVLVTTQKSYIDDHAEGKKLTQPELIDLAKEYYGDLSKPVEWKKAKKFLSDARDADRIIRKEFDPDERKTGFWSKLQRDASSDPWFDEELKSIVNLLQSKGDNGGFIKSRVYLNPVAEFHSIHGAEDVASDIYELLVAGKIVIIDLSVGKSSIRESLAERISRSIFDKSMGTFHAGEQCPNIVLYVEEAHNLIGKNAEPDETWPRIAKEGAKANIALVYATQEPSSIQSNIMANTENWIVTHLNNDDELRVLGKFYDFSDFTLSLKRAQDVGFARVKTLSSPYVIPTQIDLFSPEHLKQQLKGGESGKIDAENSLVDSDEKFFSDMLED
ncbi:ATP-binding protein [Vibrio alginolyticus]|uniref:ATP-binding protein n=1 Tax=Vibrio alginolyticus TaxID=663 RepID=UPI003218B5E1